MLRFRAGLEAADQVVLALVFDRGLPAPREPDDLDRLCEGVDRLLRGTARSAHRLDPIPEGTRAETQLEAAVREDVDRGGCLGQNRRRPQRQVGHVGHEAHPLRARCDVGEELERVEEAPLVGVILDPDQVEA